MDCAIYLTRSLPARWRLAEAHVTPRSQRRPRPVACRRSNRYGRRSVPGRSSVWAPPLWLAVTSRLKTLTMVSEALCADRWWRVRLTIQLLALGTVATVADALMLSYLAVPPFLFDNPANINVELPKLTFASRHVFGAKQRY